jgi:alkylation response protein AidB-like acyl-CoA dehydrogenase
MEYKVAIEELAKVCGSIGLSMAAHNSLCTNHILMFGSDEQKRRFLPSLASGEHIGSWGLTEANTGSDAMRMQCTASRDDDRQGWVLNGTKNWITHGISSDVAVVLARTGELLDSHGITAFVVLRSQSGF